MGIIIIFIVYFKQMPFLLIHYLKKLYSSEIFKEHSTFISAKYKYYDFFNFMEAALNIYNEIIELMKYQPKK